MLVGIAGGYLFQGMRDFQRKRGEEEAGTKKDVTPAIAQVGDFVITAGMVDAEKSEMVKQGGQDTSPMNEAYYLGTALGDEVNRGLMYKLMRENGIKVSDEDIIRKA